MIFHLQVFGRGITIVCSAWDPVECCKTYFSVGWLRRQTVTTQYSFRTADRGGIEFMVRRKHQVQGWRLRGPIEHFESQ